MQKSDSSDRAAWALAASLALLALVFFSRRVHGDIFDELTDLERALPPLNAKHPLADPIVWLVVHAAQRLFGADSSLRAVQLWNALWMSVALVGVYVCGVRARLASSAALALAVLLAGTFSALHFLRDPFLYYFPPSLACLTWSAALGLRATRRARTGGTALALLAGLFNPLTLPGAVATVSLGTQAGSRRRVLAFAALALGLGIAPLLLVPRRADLQFVLSSGGVYGRWRSDTLSVARSALGESLLAAEMPARPVGLILLGACALSAILLVVRGARRERALPFVAALVATTIVVAWWDPAQPFFWLLVVWLVVLAVLVAEPELPRRAGAALWTVAALVAIGNFQSYVLPTLRGPDPHRTLAEQAKRSFKPSDLIVFSELGEPALLYYAKLESTGFLALLGHERPAFEAFLALFQEVRERGGRLYVEVDEYGRVLAPASFPARELSRLTLGVELRIGWTRVRRVRDIQRQPPCGAAELLPTRRPGVRVAASAFDEHEFGRHYAPERALDGAPETEWLCSGVWSDSLDLSFDPPRRLSAVRLSNARNPPYYDHATLSYRLEAWRQGKLVAERDGTLADTRREGVWHSAALSADAVDCLRFVVLEHRGRGGGLSEIDPR